MPNYSIRKPKDTDIEGIASLHQKIWPDDFKQEDEYFVFWKWLFENNPLSIQKALVGSDNNNRILSHCALIPFSCNVLGKEYTGGFICQLMVDEHFRKELLFLQMELKLLKEYEKAGMEFVYGLINIPEVLKAHLVFRFKKIGTLPVYARPFQFSEIARHFISHRLIFSFLKPFLLLLQRLFSIPAQMKKKKTDVKIQKRFDSRFDDFYTRMLGYYPAMAVRNSQVLNWRFVDFPKRDYKILIMEEREKISGYIVLRQIKMLDFHVLAVVDILYPPEREDIGKRLLKAAHQEAAGLKVDMTACLLNPHSPMLSLFKKRFYFKTPESFVFILHERGKTISKEEFKNWHLSWFDHDYV